MMEPRQNCSVVGCAGGHTSLYRLPHTSDIRAKWLHFIYGGNVPHSVGRCLLVCAKHFTADCFSNLSQYKAGLALRLTVKDGSIPSLRATEEGSTCKSGLVPARRHVPCRTDPATFHAVSVRTVQSDARCTDLGEEYPPPKRQEWSSRVEQDPPQTPHIKDEDEEPQPPRIKKEENDYSISQDGEHLEGLEAFPVTGVPVKSDDDEVKGESEERGGGEPPSSSSTQHMTTEADGDHCGGSQADKLVVPLSDSEDTTSHSPDIDDEDFKDDKTCHTDDTHFKCSFCDKSFCKKGNLKRHMRSHAGIKDFKCSKCGNMFGENSSLKIHMRKHTGERPFMCLVCGKRFSQKVHLTAHGRTHTIEKPFACSVCAVCGKGFFQKAHLEEHTRIHTGEKPFACSVCRQSFSLKSSLKIHARTHTGEKPFACSVCGKSFAHRSSWMRHSGIHTGEKPYACVVCKRSFSQNEYLVAHRRTHTGEKPFPCSVCHTYFGDRSALRKHKKKHAGQSV